MKRWLRQVVDGCQTDALPLHRASVKRYKADAAADSDAVLYSCATVMTMVLKTKMMLAVMHPRVVRWHLFTKWIREWQIAAYSWTQSVPHQRDCQNVVMLNRLSTTGRSAGTVYAMALCLSVTSRCSTKMVRRSITLTVPHDSPRTLVVF